MPNLKFQSYAQTLTHQIGPIANQMLNKVFDDFSEKLKNPDSPERKIFHTIIAIIACTMLLEKLAQETLNLLYYFENLNKREGMIRAAKSTGANEVEEPEVPVEKVDMGKILAELDSRLTEIGEKKSLLQEEFDKNMESLRKQESEMLDEIFSAYDIKDDYKNNFYTDGPDKRNKIIELYAQREEQKSERLEKLQEMVEAHSTNESVGTVRDDASAAEDFSSDKQQKVSQQPERDYAVQQQEMQQRLYGALKGESGTVQKTYGINTSIHLLTLLKENLGDNRYSLSVLKSLTNQIDAKENGIMLLKKGLQENHDVIIKWLDNEAEKIQEQRQIWVEKCMQSSPTFQVTAKAPESRNTTEEKNNPKEDRAAPI